jgi:hypothetical protein
MSLTDAAAVLGRYDDEAWIALASRGLLRRARKDLETLAVRVTGETQDGVEIAVGDQAVRIGAAGPGGLLLPECGDLPAHHHRRALAGIRRARAS